VNERAFDTDLKPSETLKVKDDVLGVDSVGVPVTMPVEGSSDKNAGKPDAVYV
jgi:hypothetical protein